MEKYLNLGTVFMFYYNLPTPYNLTSVETTEATVVGIRGYPHVYVSHAGIFLFRFLHGTQYHSSTSDISSNRKISDHREADAATFHG